ncbi:MAG: Uncharacterized Nudix hydrolase NudL, partial [uncultured Rubrobacteraceae bacterium]
GRGRGDRGQGRGRRGVAAIRAGQAARWVARGLRELLAGGSGDGGEAREGAAAGHGLPEGRRARAGAPGARGAAARLHGEEGRSPGPRRPNLLPRRRHGPFRRLAYGDRPARGGGGDRPEEEPRRDRRRAGGDVHTPIQLQGQPVRWSPARRGRDGPRPRRGRGDLYGLHRGASRPQNLPEGPLAPRRPRLRGTRLRRRGVAARDLGRHGRHDRRPPGPPGLGRIPRL